MMFHDLLMISPRYEMCKSSPHTAIPCLPCLFLRAAVFSSGTAGNQGRTLISTTWPHAILMRDRPLLLSPSTPRPPTSHKVKPETRNYILKDREIRLNPPQPRPLYF